MHVASTEAMTVHPVVSYLPGTGTDWKPEGLEHKKVLTRWAYFDSYIFVFTH